MDYRQVRPIPSPIRRLARRPHPKLPRTSASIDWFATRVCFNAPGCSRGGPAVMTHSKRAISSDIPVSRTSHLALEA